MEYNSTQPFTNTLNLIWTAFVWIITGLFSASWIFPSSFGQFLLFLSLWGFAGNMVLYFSALLVQFIEDHLLLPLTQLSNSSMTSVTSSPKVRSGAPSNMP